MNKLSHIDQKGKANMVDVGSKPEQERIAKASGFISLNAEAMKQVKENQNKKGDVLTVAEIAGIQAAKSTANLIPHCHPLQLTKVDVKTVIEADGIRVICEARCIGRTGAEMEALTGASVGLLTIYDMCKAVDDKMVIGEVRLIDKQKQDV